MRLRMYLRRDVLGCGLWEHGKMDLNNIQVTSDVNWLKLEYVFHSSRFCKQALRITSEGKHEYTSAHMA